MHRACKRTFCAISRQAKSSQIRYFFYVSCCARVFKEFWSGYLATQVLFWHNLGISPGTHQLEIHRPLLQHKVVAKDILWSGCFRRNRFLSASGNRRTFHLFKRFAIQNFL